MVLRTRTRSPSSWGGGSVVRGTLGWYGDASGGFFLKSLDEWNPRLAFLVFPRITSSSRIDRRDIGRFELQAQPISTLSIARQVRELQAALSVNKSELARILRVSRPTVYDWLDGGEPNADNRSRIRTLLRLVAESRVSANKPLFPRFVRAGLESGERGLLELLGEERIDEVTAKDVIRRAKALGDAMDGEREERDGSAAGGWFRGAGGRAAEGESGHECCAHGVAARVGMARQFDPDRVMELEWRQGLSTLHAQRVA